MKQYKTIEEYVYQHAQEEPDRVSIRTVDGCMTNRELFDAADRYAQYLKRNGIKRGSIVVTRAANTIEYAVLYLGVHLAGGVICSLEKSSPAATVASVADSLGAVMVIADDIPQEGSWSVIPRNVLEDAAGSEASENVVFSDPEDSADILFTTGTTGASKGVELSHKALTATAENLIYGCGYEKDMVLVVPGPLNHANAIRKLFTSLINGNCIYLLNGLTNVRNFFDALDQDYPKAACCLPPAMIRVLLTVAKDKLAEYRDKICFIESASAPLPEADRVRLIEILPQTRLIINYGSSEAASVTMYDCNAHPGLLNCIGKPMPNAQILIVDDEKKPMDSSPDRMGLIACRGDVNMKGYVNAPDLTAEVLVDSIVYTNDVGYMDQEGFIYIYGRKGDVINVGGLKVAPTEVEDAALEHEMIQDCICIAAEDAISGHVPKLLYVAEMELPPRELSAFLAQRLENYKVPKRFERTGHIARTYNGKLDRKAYR